MPSADYLCKLCHQTFEHSESDLPDTIELEHSFSEELVAKCENKILQRVWTVFNLGSVKGAGVSPSKSGLSKQ
jgi:hypothetical protein